MSDGKESLVEEEGEGRLESVCKGTSSASENITQIETNE